MTIETPMPIETQGLSMIGPVTHSGSTSSTSRSRPRAMLIRCRLGRRIGFPDMRPSSFRNAMTEPVKVMARMATPSPISKSEPPWTEPTDPMPKA